MYDPYVSYILTAILFIIFILTVLRNAWANEDAFITMRVIDNFVNGYGLTWNINERVYVYTHPLWMLTLIPFYYLSRDAFFTLIFVSSFFAVVSIVLINKLVGDRIKFIFLLFSFMLSKAFMDYAGCGLENSFSIFLFFIFCIYLFKENKNFLMLSFIAALSALNRIDTLILFLPALFFIYITQPDKKKNFLKLILGFLPLILWFLFSIIYYGFPLPNTYYAKVKTGYSLLWHLNQGAMYFYQFFRLDLISAILLLFAIILVFIFKNRYTNMLCIGIVLYLLYILKIGGDYMTGRFLTLTIAAAMVIIVKTELKFNYFFYLFTLLLLIYIGTNNKYLPVYSNSNYGQPTSEIAKIDIAGVSDQRFFFYPEFGFLNKNRLSEYPGKIKRIEKTLKDFKIKNIVLHYLGKNGYEAGPDIHIIDDLAITEPLLARLYPLQDCRIGHFQREIPDGYLETLVKGENLIYDKNLALYYDRLKLIISGNIFSIQRLKEIIKMNSGVYNSLIKKYHQNKKENELYVSYDAVNREIQEGTPWDDKNNIFIPSGGLIIKLDKISYKNYVNISVSKNEYDLIFLKQGSAVYTTKILPPPLNLYQFQLLNNIINLPDEVAKAGYDTIKIKLKPYSDFRMATLGNVVF